MAFITLSGTLLDPNGDLAVGDQIRFTHKSTTGETVQSAVSIITVNPAGTYSLPLQYGLVLVEYKDVRTQQFKNLGVATVNQDNPATSIPELLNALVPVSSAELIEFQAILADCVTAQTSAENAATTAEAFAYQLTTTDLIASTATFAAATNIPTSGFTTSGDGGNGSWKQTGLTGQTPSQSPGQLGGALLNDGNGNQWAIVGNIISPKALGVIGDGVINDDLAYNAAKSFSGNLDMSEITTMLITNAESFSSNNPNPKLSGPLDRVFQTEGLDNQFVGGKYIGDTGNIFTFLLGANNGLIAKDINIDSPAFSFLVKPSLMSGGFAQNMLITNNIVNGVGVNTDVGISIDGDTKNTVVSNNIVKNIQRVDDVRLGHAFPVAGNNDDIPIEDCTNLIHALNSAHVAGTLYHVEDDCSNLVVIANNAENVETGIEIINDHVPNSHQYAYNNIQFTEYAIDCAGTGNSKNIGFSFNNFDGSLATQTTFGVRINQLTTKNINYIGNMHKDFSDKGLEITAQGLFSIAYNVFDTIAGVVFTGSGSGSINEGNRGVIIESNNKFLDSGPIYDKLLCKNFMGDQNVVSDSVNANTAEDKVMFVAQRDGVVTAFTRVLESVGGGGTITGAFTVSKVTAGVKTTIITNSIPRTGLQYEAFTWGMEHVQILDNDFARGDVIVIETDGLADASTLARIQMEFFYYN